MSTELKYFYRGQIISVQPGELSVCVLCVGVNFFLSQEIVFMFFFVGFVEKEFLPAALKGIFSITTSCLNISRGEICQS